MGLVVCVLAYIERFPPRYPPMTSVSERVFTPAQMASPLLIAMVWIPSLRQKW